jgi:hypothetical protein
VLPKVFCRFLGVPLELHGSYFPSTASACLTTSSGKNPNAF